MCSRRYAACNVHAPYSHLWPASLYNIYPHYLINGTIFGKKKKLLDMKCSLLFSTTFVWKIFIVRRNEEDTIKNTYWYSCKVPRYSCSIFIFLDRFSKNTQVSYFMKIRPMGIKCFHHADRWTDGRTNMTKLIVVFRNFAKAPKIKKCKVQWITRVFTMPSHIHLWEYKKCYSLIHVGFKTIWQIG
jgi:hypothetical protein